MRTHSLELWRHHWRAFLYANKTLHVCPALSASLLVISRCAKPLGYSLILRWQLINDTDCAMLLRTWCHWWGFHDDKIVLFKKSCSCYNVLKEGQWRDLHATFAPANLRKVLKVTYIFAVYKFLNTLKILVLYYIVQNAFLGSRSFCWVWLYSQRENNFIILFTTKLGFPLLGFIKEKLIYTHASQQHKMVKGQSREPFPLYNPWIKIEKSS